MHRGGVRAVGYPHGHQHVGRVGLGVPDLGDPVPVIVEHAGIQQLVLHVELAAPAVFRQQVLIRERGLRIVVPPPVPGVAGRCSRYHQYSFTSSPWLPSSPVSPNGRSFKIGSRPVPQRQPQAQPLLHIAETGQAILAPPVGPGPGRIVRQVIPRPAVRAAVPPETVPHCRSLTYGPHRYQSLACRSPSSSRPNPATRSRSAPTTASLGPAAQPSTGSREPDDSTPAGDLSSPARRFIPCLSSPPARPAPILRGHRDCPYHQGRGPGQRRTR